MSKNLNVNDLDSILNRPLSDIVNVGKKLLDAKIVKDTVGAANEARVTSVGIEIDRGPIAHCRGIYNGLVSRRRPAILLQLIEGDLYKVVEENIR